LSGPNHTSLASAISNRRSSSAVLASSGQAPINRVVNLLIQAQEKSSPEVALSLDKVINILFQLSKVYPFLQIILKTY